MNGHPARKGIQNIGDAGPPGLQELLTQEGVKPAGKQSLVVLSFNGNIQGNVDASKSFSGGVNVGIKFKAGAGLKQAVN